LRGEPRFAELGAPCLQISSIIEEYKQYLL
jgi:hypothetical protein